MVGFPSIGLLCKSMEDLLDAIADAETPPDEAALGFLQAAHETLEQLVPNPGQTGLVGRVPIPVKDTVMTPNGPRAPGYHDFYIAYDAATHQDKFYGAGMGGYYVYDVSNLKEPKLLTSITGVSGNTISVAHAALNNESNHAAVLRGQALALTPDKSAAGQGVRHALVRATAESR